MKYIALISLMMSSLASATTTDYEWLVGRWCSVTAKRAIEETWLPDTGTILLGLSHTRAGSRSVGFEFMRIEAIDGVDHFVAQPGGGAPVYFRRTTGGEAWVRFDNPAHDFPQRIEYRRDGDRLLAEIGGTGDDGKEMSTRFEYQACQ